MFVRSKILKSTHAFATRLGGVSIHDHTKELNLAFDRGDDETIVLLNLDIFAKEVGFDKDCVVSFPQIHSDIIYEVGQNECGYGYKKRDGIPSGDGYFTAEKGVVLGIKTADCVPVLFEAELNGEIIGVGAVHSGWRGTAAGIAPKCVQKMLDRFCIQPENIRAAIGPCIGKCCYEVSEDVFTAIKENHCADIAECFVRAIPQKDGKYLCDLPSINAELLKRSGIPEENIDIIGECTCCHPEKYFSHRYTDGYRGTLLNIICR